MYRILLLIIPFGLLANPVELKLNQDIQGCVAKESSTIPRWIPIK